MAGRRDCHARQYGDQMCCGKCALAWDVNDPDPPTCGEASPAPADTMVEHVEAGAKRGRELFLEYMKGVKS
jgi:hypothetical protein